MTNTLPSPDVVAKLAGAASSDFHGNDISIFVVKHNNEDVSIGLMVSILDSCPSDVLRKISGRKYYTMSAPGVGDTLYQLIANINEILTIAENADVTKRRPAVPFDQNAKRSGKLDIRTLTDEYLVVCMNLSSYASGEVWRYTWSQEA